MSEPIISFIMSGGIGSRLWPLSREDFPKQFHSLAGNKSMLVRTLERLKSGNDKAPINIIASEAHEARLREDVSPIALEGGQIIYEPLGRNTAAAVALATQMTLKNYGDQLVLVVPSDHAISTDQDFWDTIHQGEAAARAGKLVVFGIRPDKPETGYGYIETGKQDGVVYDVQRFVEKPDLETAKHYLQSGQFLWNSGIFLFSAQAMADAFQHFAADIWDKTALALDAAQTNVSGTWLPHDLYAQIPSNSLDYAIMEQAKNIVLVPARFQWNDLGSWQSLLDAQSGTDGQDAQGNVVVGDVVAIDCEGSYLRSEGGLLAVVGVRDMAVVSTVDATFVAPVDQSQNVREIVSRLEKTGRLEGKFTPAPDRLPVAGAYTDRVRHWLFEEALPLWSTKGVDHQHGGFYEALDFKAQPLLLPKRTRTMARQIYAFAITGTMGWSGPWMDLIDHGLKFITQHARTKRGGWVSSVNHDGSVHDSNEDLYDQAFVLLALAYAHKSGHKQALPLAMETMAFIDLHLGDQQGSGFWELPLDQGGEHKPRRSNPHMHLLEAFLAWYRVSNDKDWLQRANHIVDLFRFHFFDSDSWTLGEYYDQNWQRLAGEQGQLWEPGHHFEWASLLVDFDHLSQGRKYTPMARKLYACAVANGLNRATGLAYNIMSLGGLPVDRHSRSWPQTEAIKAALALDGRDGPDLKPEIEARVGRLFRWHIEPAPLGMWIDLIDEQGRGRATQVPASIFYHLVSALENYLRVIAAR